MGENPATEVDHAKVGQLFEGPGVEVSSVRASRRDGRRFVHVRLEVDDVRQLSRLAPFSWSTYQLGRRGELLEYRQLVGGAAAKAVRNVGWTGNELVAFRMHIPSVIAFHNSPSRRVQRGNILEWEQPPTNGVRAAAESFWSGVPGASAKYRAAAERYLRLRLRTDAFRCIQAVAQANVKDEATADSTHYRCDVWVCDELPFGVAQVEWQVSDARRELQSRQRLTVTAVGQSLGK